MRGVILPLLAVVVCALPVQAQQLTGCLDLEMPPLSGVLTEAPTGLIYNVAQGAAPLNNCGTGDPQVSWNVQGPQGPAGPPGPAAPQPPAFRLVGVTTQQFQGNGTRIAMNAACASEFPGSRLAYSDEASSTVPLPDIPGPAWIQPRIVAVLGNWGVDAAGNTFNACGNPWPGNVWGAVFDCQSWLSADIGRNCGPVLGTAGSMWSIPCGLTLGVACAAPVEE